MFKHIRVASLGGGQGEYIFTHFPHSLRELSITALTGDEVGALMGLESLEL